MYHDWRWWIENRQPKRNDELTAERDSAILPIEKGWVDGRKRAKKNTHC